MEGQIVIKCPFHSRGWRLRKIIWHKQGFFFAMPAWLMLCDSENIAFNEIDSLGKDLLRKIFYHAARYYNLSNNIPVNFDDKDAILWDELLPNGDYQKLVQTMIDSRVGGETLGSLIARSGEDEKKKSGLMKSGTSLSEESG